MAEHVFGINTKDFTIDSQIKIFLNKGKINTNHIPLKTPADSNSLFASVIVGHLTKFHHNYASFIKETHRIFASFGLHKSKYEELYKLMDNLTTEGNYEKFKPWIILSRIVVANFIQKRLYDVFAKDQPSFNELITRDLRNQRERLIESINSAEADLQLCRSIEHEKSLLQYIRNTNLYIKKIENNPINFYLSELKKSRYDGGQIELHALAEITNSDIKVYSDTDFLQFNSANKEETKDDIILVRTSGNRYITYIPNLAQQTRFNQLVTNNAIINKISGKLHNQEISSSLYRTNLESLEEDNKNLLEQINIVDHKYAYALQDLYYEGEEIDFEFEQ